MTEWPSDRVTKWPSDQVTKRPSNRVTKWPNDQMTKWPSDQMTKWPSDLVTKWPSDQVTDLPSDQVTEGFADDWPYGIFIEDKRVEMTNFFVWGCFLFLNDNKHLAWGWCNEIRSRTISNITPFWVGKFWYFWRLPILSDCFDVPDYVLCKYIQYEYFCKILIKVCSVGTSPPLQINCTKYDILEFDFLPHKYC